MKSKKKYKKYRGKRNKVFLYSQLLFGERGSNEKNNKLIKCHISKRVDMGDITEEVIKEIEYWMNNYLRKLFGRKSSNEVYGKSKKYIL